MNQQAIAHEDRPSANRPELAGNSMRYRKRRRLQLRHEAAVVVAEIRRMQRAHWSATGDDLSARLVS